MASPLSADTIISQFEECVQDELDQVSELFLLNEVKDTIETSRAWAFLTAKDATKTVPSGVAWQSPIALPTDFAIPSPRGIYAGTDLIAYKQVPFEAQVDFQSITYAYFIDYYNSNYYLCGNPTPGQTVNFFYRRFSPTLALTANGGQPWVFPARFHPLLVYEMAIKYFTWDQGDKSRSWDDRWEKFAMRTRDQMEEWDDELQTKALMNEQDFNVNVSSEPNIINMDTGGMNGGIMYG
jgi:hypothetical protein